MDKHGDCVADGTRTSSIRKVAVAVFIGYVAVLACNPGSIARWAYMLPDSELSYALQDSSDAFAGFMESAWESLGMRPPFDELQDRMAPYKPS